RQRLDILLKGPDTGLSRSFTITLPPEVTVVSGSVTATSDNASLVPFISGFPTASKISVGLTGTMTARTVTLEFDVRTPSSFTGRSSGTALDTAYVFDFNAAFANNSDKKPPVALNQNKPVRFVTFASPDSSIGDTTTLGGRLYKMGFPSRFGPSDREGLPDLAHSGLTTKSRTFTDNQTDVSFSFYVSTDSTLIGNSGLTASSLFTIGADDVPLVGQRQNPRLVPTTFIREDFTTTFADSTEALISLASTAHNGKVYVYVSSSVTGDFFIGRSGTLLTPHPPEFVIGGWDYDDEGGDDFNTTGLVQVNSEMIGGGGQKDNNAITVDSGGYMPRGSAIPHGGFRPTPLTSINFLFDVEDADNLGTVLVGIFMTPDSLADRTVADLLAPDSLRHSRTVADSLSASERLFNFEGLFRNSTTGLVNPTSVFDAGKYKVYFGAIDGNGNKALYKVRVDPFANPSTDATVTISHSPQMTPDTNQFNDGDGDGDLDVETGIGVSQMITSTTGQNLSFGPSTRNVAISWGRAGIEGDLDADDDATVAFYYSTRTDFRTVEGSVANTSGNSDGADLLAAIVQRNNDTHRIVDAVGIKSDDLFDNIYNWDVWNYVSPEDTVPSSDTRYYIYGILTGGTTNRLVSFTNEGAINFTHPPYVTVTEPSVDQTVNINDPIQVSWKAIDVDNGYSIGTPTPGGLAAPNNRTNAPNIRILLTSSDFGDVTTWATVTAQAAVEPFWVANSTDGALNGEVELNEGVDTSFVFRGEYLINNLKAVQSNQGLKTGFPLNVYVSVDGRGTGGQPTEFNDHSPVVKAPGQIIFSGNEPKSAPTATTEFIVPEDLEVTVGETFQYGVIPDVAPAGTAVKVVNIFLTAKVSAFTPLDTDAATAGIQPFTIGTPEHVSSSKVSQGAYIDPSDNTLWRLDFRFDDSAGSGLTFFDGVHPIAIANFESTGGTGSSEITLDGSGSRESNMLDNTRTDLDPPSVGPTTVNVNGRATVSGQVQLQGRDDIAHPSAAKITFFLREVGSFTSFTDSLFEIADEDTVTDGIQITTTGVNGDYSLPRVPPGRWIVTAAHPRYLTGHDTVYVPAGVGAVSNINPVKLGNGIGTELLGGDAAGYTDTSGASVPDNFIGPEDISAINAALFKPLGNPDYNTFADINQDSVVNGTDKDMATANQTSLIGEIGKKMPIFPTFKRTVSAARNAEAMLKVTGYPDHEIKPGETFDITIGVEGASAVRTYEFHLSFDPNAVTVVDLVSAGDLFAGYNADMGGKLLDGELGMVNSILGHTELGASGDGSLATIRFQAIGRSIQVPFALTDGLLINVDHDGSVPQIDDQITVSLSKDPIFYHDADGERVLGLILADQDPVVDFNDFVAFAGAFGTASGDAQYDFRADLNGDDAVDFADFLIFADNFGRVAVDVPPALTRSKPVTGANAGAMVSLAVANEARMGELLTLNAMVADAQALQGYGLSVAFDATQYEFVEARAPEGNLLTSVGAEAPLFLVNTDESGVVKLASAVGSGPVASGEGVVAELVFRPIGDVETGLFDIAQGVVFDPSQFQNRAGTPGSLKVRAIPTEFALNQNFPNPFNPETTISYDLADGGRVELAIYNVMGQQVKQLVAEEQSAGRYRVVWDGSDAVGRSVASGVYFYRLNTTQFNAVRKLMLLK
ncbi:TPA: hypothetical protein DCE37_11565, partial [Candidatus Latescibacteria bacterium]|nr:hypothetical protein [Candidatus Latescibacterota bacterium]